jgi:hypothetical protein
MAVGKSVLARLLEIALPGVAIVDDAAAGEDLVRIEKQLAEGGVVVVTAPPDRAEVFREVIKFDIVIGIEGNFGSCLMGAQGGGAMRALLSCVGERRSQVSREGYVAAHDDEHTGGQLASAAACYATNAAMVAQHGELPPCFIPKGWPWERRWWKPSHKNHGGAKRDVEKAVGLLLAEWERLDRIEQAKAGGRRRA